MPTHILVLLFMAGALGLAAITMLAVRFFTVEPVKVTEKAKS